MQQKNRIAAKHMREQREMAFVVQQHGRVLKKNILVIGKVFKAQLEKVLVAEATVKVFKRMTFSSEKPISSYGVSLTSRAPDRNVLFFCKPREKGFSVKLSCSRKVKLDVTDESAQKGFQEDNLVALRHRTATAGSDVVQSGRPIFDDFFQHLWPYIGNNTANVVSQMVKRLWLIRIDQ
ncbi:adhesion G protein-coupled receptor B2 [Trichonephila clavipes]|nr:adhesion G protein-coupled receptor B2 [Trichonephila clavipes]